LADAFHNVGKDMVTTTKITHSNAGLGEGILCGGFDGTVTHVDTREFNQRLQFCASGGAIRDLTTLDDYSIATASGEVVQSTHPHYHPTALATLCNV
jgi:hypothetical protein